MASSQQSISLFEYLFSFFPDVETDMESRFKLAYGKTLTNEQQLMLRVMSLAESRDSLVLEKSSIDPTLVDVDRAPLALHLILREIYNGKRCILDM